MRKTRLGVIAVSVVMMILLCSCQGRKEKKETPKKEDVISKSMAYIGEAEVTEYKDQKITWGLPTLQGTQSEYQDKFSQFVYTKQTDAEGNITKNGTKYEEIVQKIGEPEEKKSDTFSGEKGVMAIWGNGVSKVKIYFDDNSEADIMMMYADFPKDHWSKNKWLTEFGNSLHKKTEEATGTSSEEVTQKFGQATEGTLENGSGDLIWVDDNTKTAMRVSFQDNQVSNSDVGILSK